MAEGGPPKVLPSSGHSKGNVGNQPTGGPLGAGALRLVGILDMKGTGSFAPPFLRPDPNYASFPVWLSPSVVAKRQSLGA